MVKKESKTHPHEDIINGAYEQFKGVLEESKQAIYIYYDDSHKICNQQFASMLGYYSVEEWSSVDEPFPETFVMDESQENLISAYRKAREEKIASEIEVSWKKKTGASVKSRVILVPISYNGKLLALHFITKI